jgi:hypothetical protein
VNSTLNEVEDMKQLPDHIEKRDARLAITRYGIDRFTLLNAGIPNEEVTRLYKTMFVHTQGMLQSI